MAKPFQFKLQKVLDYRAQLEDQAKMDLARAQAAHDAQQRTVADIQRRLAAHVEQGFQDGRADAEGVSPGDIWLWRQYKDALEQDLTEAKAVLGKLALKLQKARQVLVSRSKDKKLLEKLKEKQARRHHEEESQREEKEFDELAAIRHEPENL